MRYAVVMLCLTLAACGDKTPVDPDALTPATYLLESINDRPVPAPIPRDSLGRTALSGAIVLTASHYSRTLLRRTAAGVVDTARDSGPLEHAVASTYRMVGAFEPSTVAQWGGTYVMVGTSWYHSLWRRQ